MRPSAISRVSYVATVGAWLLVAGVLYTVSQSGRSYGDEGYQLVASQLILSGKQPYVDFFYQHPPAYIQMDAAWMALFGKTWRSSHLFSALCTMACTVLLSIYVTSCFSTSPWKILLSCWAAILYSLNPLTLRLGTMSQPYSLCTLLLLISFLLLLRSKNGKRRLLIAAGLCAGASASVIFLSLPAILLFLAYCLYNAPRDTRIKHVFSFGVATSIVPVICIFSPVLSSPRSVFFDLIEYHLRYRRAGLWNNPQFESWNWNVLTSWMWTPMGALCAVLAIAGVLFLFQSRLPHERNKEFILCGGLVIALSLIPVFVRPTFEQYFYVLMPFVFVLVSAGLFGFLEAFKNKSTLLTLSFLSVILFGCIFGGIRDIWKTPADTWGEFEKVAREVNRVTPPAAAIFAPERVYFAAGRIPPSGMENYFSSELNLPAELSRELHVLSRAQLDHNVLSGGISTLALWNYDPLLSSPSLLRLYIRQKTFDSLGITVWVLDASQ